MEYVRLGQSGLKVSRICLGMMTYGSRQWRPWVLEAAAAESHVKRALDLGINFFDTANMYSLGVSEELTGQALKKFARRDEVVIATKVYQRMSDDPNAQGLSRKHIMDQVDASLRRLQVDYIDLYQIHRWDDNTPIEETLAALNDLVRSGKVRYLGASSMFAWQMTKALYLADQQHWTRFISMQNHYNLVYREEEREMMPLCAAEGIGVIPWSPLARGFLAGNRQRDDHRPTARAENDAFADNMYFADADFDVVDAVVAIAGERGLKPAQVALAWLLGRPQVTAPIIGTTKIEHINDAVEAVEIKLSDDEVARLEAPYVPHTVLGHR